MSGRAASAFFVPQMLMATLLGMISDRLGRKPVLILGLLGSALCGFLFGLSRSLSWAILSRALCGLFNGMKNIRIGTPRQNPHGIDC